MRTIPAPRGRKHLSQLVGTLLVLLAAGMAPLSLAAQLVMTSPLPGQALNPGERVQIEWQITPAAAPVNLAYSDDEGRSWVTIALDQRGASFNWIVPPDVQNTVLVRVARVAGANPVPALEIAHSRAEIRCLRFDATGERLLASTAEGLVDVYDTQDGQLLATAVPPGEPSIIYQAQFLAGGPEIVFSRANDLFLWSDFSAAPRALNVTGHDDFIRAMNSHPTRRLTVSADNAGTVVIWDLESFTALRVYRTPADRLYDVRFSASGRYIIYGGDRGRVYVRDWENEAETAPPAYTSGSHGIITERPDGSLDTNARLIWSLAMNAEETWLASAGADRTVRRWNFGERINEVAQNFDGHTLQIRSVAITPRGDRVISGAQDQSIRQWDPVGSLEIGPTLLHGGQVLAIDYAATRDLIASAGRSPLIKIWESGYSAAISDTTEITIGRREIALQIPDLQSSPRRRIEVPILLTNRAELDLSTPISVRLQIFSPRLLAEIEAERIARSAQLNFGMWDTLLDSLDINIEIDGSSDTVAVFPILVLQGTPTVQSVNFRSVEILSQESIDIVQRDGSISIAGECGDDITPREFVITQRTALGIVGLAPNPAVRTIDVNWRQTAGANVDLTILDAQGTVVQALNNSGHGQGHGTHSRTVNIEGLLPGSYFLRLDDGVQSVSRKFVVVR